MAYPTITPVTSMPADGADADGIKLDTYDMALAMVYASAGSGTATLIMRDPAGRWIAAAPSWTVDTTVAGRALARFKIWRNAIPGTLWQILVTGGPTLDPCYLVGVNDAW